MYMYMCGIQLYAQLIHTCRYSQIHNLYQNPNVTRSLSSLITLVIFLTDCALDLNAHFNFKTPPTNFNESDVHYIFQKSTSTDTEIVGGRRASEWGGQFLRRYWHLLTKFCAQMAEFRPSRGNYDDWMQS